MFQDPSVGFHVHGQERNPSRRGSSHSYRIGEDLIGCSAALCENMGHTYSSMGNYDEAQPTGASESSPEVRAAPVFVVSFCLKGVPKKEKGILVENGLFSGSTFGRVAG